MKQILAVFTILLIACTGMAQKHDYTWMFGYANGSNDPLLGGVNIDFNFQPPHIYLQKKKIDLGFYCAVASDSFGQLIFYTNGISIRDRNHNKMENGDTINPGPLWTSFQNSSYPNGPFCFSLPAPGKSNQYYLFHMAGDITNAPVTSPFYYSIIDMNGNNGLGVVTKKNKIILPLGKDYICPVAVKHGNGRDWWVITGEISTTNLFTFLLDSDGVHGPFTTTMPFQLSNDEYQSINTISPDGHTYVRSDGEHGLYIFDFDRCSGSFYNMRVLPFGNESFFSFATVFAADSRHLYMSSWDVITVLDLGDANIASTLDTLAYFDGKASPSAPFLTGFFIPNLGPDGKIYYSTTNSTLSMHVIHNPDLPGIAADVEQHGLALPKFNDGTMPLFPNYRLGALQGSDCDTLNFQEQKDHYVENGRRSFRMNTLNDYLLLPPLLNDAKPSGARRPNLAELAFRQKRKESKQKATGQNER